MEKWGLKDDDAEWMQMVIEEEKMGWMKSSRVNRKNKTTMGGNQTAVGRAAGAGKFGQGGSNSCLYPSGSSGPSTEGSGFHYDWTFTFICNCSRDTSCINIYISWVFETSPGKYAGTTERYKCPVAGCSIVTGSKKTWILSLCTQNNFWAHATPVAPSHYTI